MPYIIHKSNTNEQGESMKHSKLTPGGEAPSRAQGGDEGGSVFTLVSNSTTATNKPAPSRAQGGDEGGSVFKLVSNSTTATKTPAPAETVNGRNGSGRANIKAGKQPGKSGVKKKRSKKRAYVEESVDYRTHIYRIFKKLHCDKTISKKAMVIMDSFAHDMFRRVVVESRELSKKAKRQTIIESDIIAAVRLVLVGELKKCAMAKGNKALKTYAANSKK